MDHTHEISRELAFHVLTNTISHNIVIVKVYSVLSEFVPLLTATTHTVANFQQCVYTCLYIIYTYLLRSDKLHIVIERAFGFRPEYTYKLRNVTDVPVLVVNVYKHKKVFLCGNIRRYIKTLYCRWILYTQLHIYVCIVSIYNIHITYIM